MNTNETRRRLDRQQDNAVTPHDTGRLTVAVERDLDELSAPRANHVIGQVKQYVDALDSMCDAYNVETTMIDESDIDRSPAGNHYVVVECHAHVEDVEDATVTILHEDADAVERVARRTVDVALDDSVPEDVLAERPKE